MTKDITEEASSYFDESISFTDNYNVSHDKSM